MRVICAWALALVVSAVLSGSDQQARRLFEEAQKAERSGDVVRAYALYSQAVARDPYNLEYWRRQQLLRIPATLRVQPTPAPAPSQKVEEKPAPAAEIREPLPPVELRARPGRIDLDLRGDSRSLFSGVARAYGLEAVFDSDYPPGGTLRFQLQQVDYREALHALEAATGSFAIPLTERRILVAQDTPQKRADLEPVVSVEVPVPLALTAQQAQEMVRAVQQALGLSRVAYDSQHAVILIRDRLSRVRPAQEMIQRLTANQPLVSIEVDFLEQAGSGSTSFGTSLQRLFPLIDFGGAWNSLASIPAGFTRFAVFGGGKTLLGIGLTDAQAFARTSQSAGHTLFRADIHSLNGQQASLHVGDKYPIITGRYLSSNPADQLAVPASVNFEDLGLVLQLTPHVNGGGEVTLDLDAEFKALTGQTVDEIPVLSNRKLTSEVRVRAGEWAVIAGLMSSSQARTISGLAGLSRIPLVGPLFRQDTRDRSNDEVLVILKPTILSPPQEAATEAVATGPEPRPRIPL